MSDRTADPKTWAYEVGQSVAEALAQHPVFASIPNTTGKLDAISQAVQQTIADYWPPPRDPT